LHASLGQLEWTVNAYTPSVAVLLLPAATLGERYGRRRALAVGLATFTAASAARALAPGVGWLIAACAVQGAGSALVLPTALALLGAAFPPLRRAYADLAVLFVEALDFELDPVRSPLQDHSRRRLSTERSLRNDVHEHLSERDREPAASRGKAHRGYAHRNNPARAERRLWCTLKPINHASRSSPLSA